MLMRTKPLAAEW